jgi:putative modified peptide
MSDTRLPKEQELQLLKKLSTDDDYRARFEKSPVDALKEIGVGDDAINKLDPVNLKPGKLANKDVITRAYKSLDELNLSDHMSMIWPMLGLNYGSRGGKD